jgi:hypothetical protein
MPPPKIWAFDNPQFANVLVLRGPEVSLFRVGGILRGQKLTSVIGAIERREEPKSAGLKRMGSIDARNLRKAQIAPKGVSLTLFGGVETPRTLKVFGTDLDPEQVLRAIVAQSGRIFHSEEEDVGVVEALPRSSRGC